MFLTFSFIVIMMMMLCLHVLNLYVNALTKGDYQDKLDKLNNSNSLVKRKSLENGNEKDRNKCSLNEAQK